MSIICKYMSFQFLIMMIITCFVLWKLVDMYDLAVGKLTSCLAWLIFLKSTERSISSNEAFAL